MRPTRSRAPWRHLHATMAAVSAAHAQVLLPLPTPYLSTSYLSTSYLCTSYLATSLPLTSPPLTSAPLTRLPCADPFPFVDGGGECRARPRALTPPHTLPLHLLPLRIGLRNPYPLYLLPLHLLPLHLAPRFHVLIPFPLCLGDGARARLPALTPPQISRLHLLPLYLLPLHLLPLHIFTSPPLTSAPLTRLPCADPFPSVLG